MLVASFSFAPVSSVSVTEEGSSCATYPCVSVKSDTAELVVHPSGSVLQLIEVRLAGVEKALHLGSKRFPLFVALTAGGGVGSRV